MIRTFAVICVLALASCGGDDEPESPAGAAPDGTAPATEAAGTAATADETTTETAGEEPPATTETEPPPSPEDQPGGAGDEEPIRADAHLAFRGGRLTPDRVEVPAFFMIELVVEMPASQRYDIVVEGPRTRDAGRGQGTFTTLLEGIRPGKSYVVRERNSGARAEIVASAEPAP